MFRFDSLNASTNQRLTESFQRFLESGQYVLGNQVSLFEKEFSEFLGVKHVLGVANGTEAIELALRALGVDQSSKVATVANAGFYTSSAALSLNASLVYMDISMKTGLATRELVEQTINDHSPDVIVLTHLYGQVVPETKQIVEMARANDIKVVEDCAQAHGALQGGAKAGSFGDIATFSHYPTKNLGALGDGGSIATNDELLFESLTRLRQYGWTQKYKVAELGRNSRLDEVQAGFLRLSLSQLEQSNQARVVAARALKTGILERVGLLEHIERDWGGGYVAHLFVLRIEPSLRESLAQHLNQNDVACDIHYPIPDHCQPAMKSIDAPLLPNSENWCESVISIPLFPSMSNQEIAQVVGAVNSWDPMPEPR